MARNEPIHLLHSDQSFLCEPEEDFHLCFPETMFNSDNKNSYLKFYDTFWICCCLWQSWGGGGARNAGRKNTELSTLRQKFIRAVLKRKMES